MSVTQKLGSTGKIITMICLGLTVVGFVIGLIAYLVRKKKREEEAKRNQSLGYSADSFIKDSDVARQTQITRELGNINIAQYRTIINTQEALDSLSSLSSLGKGLF